MQVDKKSFDSDFKMLLEFKASLIAANASKKDGDASC